MVALPKRLLNFQPPLQSKAARGLFGEKNFSLLSGGSFHQALHKFSNLILALDRGTETPGGSHDRQIAVAGVDRSYLELQIGFACQRPSGLGGDDSAVHRRARGNHRVTVNDDIAIQGRRKTLVRAADAGTEVFAEPNCQRRPSGHHDGIGRRLRRIRVRLRIVGGMCGVGIRCNVAGLRLRIVACGCVLSRLAIRVGIRSRCGLGIRLWI